MDDGRIPAGTEHFRGIVDNRIKENTGEFKKSSGFTKIIKASDNPKGRFPANLLVSDNILDDGNINKLTQYSLRKAPCNRAETYSEFNMCSGKIYAPNSYGDSGGFSRFFSLDNWWENKIKDLPESVQKTFPFLLVSKASRSEKNKGLDKKSFLNTHPQGILYNKNERPTETELRNYHPTVKSLKLMSYLITLGSRENDIILDLFAGSGTTCISAKLLNRQYIGFDINQEYVEIANKRLEHYGKN